MQIIGGYQRGLRELDEPLTKYIAFGKYFRRTENTMM